MDSTVGSETSYSAETYMGLPIKEVIARFPQVGAILSEYEVGCVDCGLGSCLLRDVVTIHDLSPEDQETLLTRIAQVVFPGQSVRLSLPAQEAASGARTGEGTSEPRTAGGRGTGRTKYSPPLRQLVEEHVLIMRLVSLVPRLLGVTDVGRVADQEVILQAVDFIRSYADRFHHAKEEDILFGYFDQSLDIIQVMLADHETARAHVRQVETAARAGEQALVTAHLQSYAELLTEHIKKEDNILYPWMDRQLTTAEVGELYAKFAEVEAAAEPGFAVRYAESIARLEREVEQREESEGGV